LIINVNNANSYEQQNMTPPPVNSIKKKKFTARGNSTMKLKGGKFKFQAA